MSGDRLTRTELSWLLTQEARSAAEKLRRGVGLTIPPPESTPMPPPTSGPHNTLGSLGHLGSHAHLKPEGGPSDGLLLPSIEDTGVETTLNRLDETMSMLASLHGHTTRGRRGKIDIAALLWEIAPEARVQIEMGKGLVVFGDESELRRMLHVLMAQSSDPMAASAVEVSVKREGDEIKVAVQLGPDMSQGFDAETQWLSRMAMRYGGRFALEGDRQTLVLRANDEHREVETLRRELAAAQAQGEAYARELAAVMGKSDVPPSVGVGSLSQHPAGEALAVVVAMSRSIVAEIRGIMASIGRDMAPLRDRARWGDRGEEVNEIASSVGRHITAASEVVSDLSKLTTAPLFDLPGPMNMVHVLRDITRTEAARAARHDVTLELQAPNGQGELDPSSIADDVLNVGTVHVLLQQLVDYALTTSQPRTTVKISVSEQETGITVMVDDTGPALSHKAKASVVNRDFDALSHERPQSLPLILAASIAAFLHAPFSLEDGPSGGTRTRVTFPRPT